MPETRLQKFLADGGITSRRVGESLILEGRVLVNGQAVRRLGTKVNPDKDEVIVDGKSVRPKRKLYLALNKPPRFLCSRNPQGDRRVIHSLLPPAWRHLQTVGRLDYDSEGLVLMTNDGKFGFRLTHPRFQVVKKYRVVVAGRIEPHLTKQLEHGALERGEHLRARQAFLVSSNNTRSVLEVDLTEGKKREIRRLLSRFGYEVERLSRIRIGRLRLGDLPPGKYRVLHPREVRTLMEDAGKAAKGGP